MGMAQWKQLWAMSQDTGFQDPLGLGQVTGLSEPQFPHVSMRDGLSGSQGQLIIISGPSRSHWNQLFSHYLPL